MSYTVQGDGKSFSDSEELSIRPAQPFLVTSTEGRLAVDSQRKGEVASFAGTRDLFREYRDVQVNVSTTPFGLLRGLIRYLREYPYGCTEQLVSKAFPGVVLGSNQELGFDKTDTDRFTESAIRTLTSRQKSDGSFGLWSLQDDGVPFYSVYATHFLLESRAHGIAVPQFLYDQALSYLKSYTTDLKYSWEDHKSQSYALYVLALSGEIVTDKVRRLESEVGRQWGEGGLSSTWIRFFLAATYKLLHLDADASRLYLEFSAEWKKTGLIPWRVAEDPAVLGLFLYITHKHFAETLGDAEFERYLWELSQEMLKGRPYSLSGSFALLGLGQFWEQFGAGKIGSFVLTESHKNEDSPLELTGTAIKRAKIEHDHSNLLLKGDGTLQLYYQLTESGYDSRMSEQSLENGLALTRRLLDEKGLELKTDATGTVSIGLNSKLIYEITLNPSQSVKDAAVVAIVPGGFEIDLSQDGLAQRKSLPVKDATVWEPRHIDVLEDRVLLFGNIDHEVKKFAFALKPLTLGIYQVPPLFGEGMYDPEISFRGISGRIAIHE